MSRGQSSPHPESRFASDWLALREGADADARSPALTAQAAAWLAARRHRPLRCIDLGSGSGANPRYLAPRLPGPQDWRLLDHDESLLAQAVQRGQALRDAAGNSISVQAERRRLETLESADLQGADLVSASALIDILGSEGIERIATATVGAGAALLLSLSVDGEWSFRRDGQDDVDPDDALARAAFNAHQRRDKGVGGAVGPDAHGFLAARLRTLGYRTEDAPSPWRLRMDRAQDAALASALLEGWLAASLEQEAGHARRLRAWYARRCSALGQPGFEIRVGHRDLFACPPGEGADAGSSG
jgi:hypothetical protein